MVRDKSTPGIVARTIVIKLGSFHYRRPIFCSFTHSGSSSIVHEQTHQPLLSTLSALVETVVELKRHGHKVVLVSSGAIAVGLKRMNVAKKPDNLSGKQVCSFDLLTQVYFSLFLECRLLLLSDKEGWLHCGIIYLANLNNLLLRFCWPEAIFLT